jgi:hypothetical protein
MKVRDKEKDDMEQGKICRKVEESQKRLHKKDTEVGGYCKKVRAGPFPPTWPITVFILRRTEDIPGKKVCRHARYARAHTPSPRHAPPAQAHWLSNLRVWET